VSVAVRAEQPADCPAVDALVASAFGPGRHAKSAYRLREGINANADTMDLRLLNQLMTILVEKKRY
jgi:predicted N-acetyltransferase YhbS